jgi:hypothetical protein
MFDVHGVSCACFQTAAKHNLGWDLTIGYSWFRQHASRFIIRNILPYLIRCYTTSSVDILSQNNPLNKQNEAEIPNDPQVLHSTYCLSLSSTTQHKQPSLIMLLITSNDGAESAAHYRLWFTMRTYWEDLWRSGRNKIPRLLMQKERYVPPANNRIS